MINSTDKHQYPYSVNSYRFYSEILEWLQVNVGELLWSHPIIAWHGEGWHIKQHAKVASRPFYVVNFEDKEKALMFGLWA